MHDGHLVGFGLWVEGLRWAEGFTALARRLRVVNSGFRFVVHAVLEVGGINHGNKRWRHPNCESVTVRPSSIGCWATVANSRKRSAVFNVSSATSRP